MRKQTKAALIGMVLAAVVFLATPAKAACNGDCANGFSSLDWSCGFIGCSYSTGSDGLTYVTCQYFCMRMNMNGMVIAETPKHTEPVDDRNDAVNRLRSDSR